MSLKYEYRHLHDLFEKASKTGLNYFNTSACVYKNKVVYYVRFNMKRSSAKVGNMPECLNVDDKYKSDLKSYYWGWTLRLPRQILSETND